MDGVSVCCCEQPPTNNRKAAAAAAAAATWREGGRGRFLMSSEFCNFAPHRRRQQKRCRTKKQREEKKEEEEEKGGAGKENGAKSGLWWWLTALGRFAPQQTFRIPSRIEASALTQVLDGDLQNTRFDQPTQIPSSSPPKRDCSTKRVLCTRAHTHNEKHDGGSEIFALYTQYVRLCRGGTDTLLPPGKNKNSSRL